MHSVSRRASKFGEHCISLSTSHTHPRYLYPRDGETLATDEAARSRKPYRRRGEHPDAGRQQHCPALHRQHHVSRTVRAVAAAARRYSMTGAASSSKTHARRRRCCRGSGCSGAGSASESNKRIKRVKRASQYTASRYKSQYIPANHDRVNRISISNEQREWAN